MARIGKHIASPKTSKGVSGCFVVLCLVAMLVPGIGMLWAPTTTTTENRQLASMPELFTQQGRINADFLADAGAYLEDHFAFRNQMVSANAHLYAALGTSPTNQVVVGTNGWLYYGGTLDDYLGNNQLSERALHNIAHNLLLLQGYVASRDAAFVFAVAPNKNSLYPQYMPWWLVQAHESGNAERLLPYLQEYGVNYVNLYEVFHNQPEVLYCACDTHWNNKGAALAADAMLRSLGKSPLPISKDAWFSRNDFVGDVAEMLYPIGAEPEQQWYVEGYNDKEEQRGSLWSYMPEQPNDVEADFTVTQSEGGQGSLVMFRDSFANATIPFTSTAFAQATYSKLVPYNAARIDEAHADCVIVERAERHLSYLAVHPPVLASPTVAVDLALLDGVGEQTSTTLQVTTDGPYTVLSGVVDTLKPGASRSASAQESDALNNAHLYVALTDASGQVSVYDAFWVSSGLADTAAANDLLADQQTNTGGQVPSSGENGAPVDINSDYGYQVYIRTQSVDLTQARVQVFGLNGQQVFGLKTFDGSELAIREKE